ncbi:MAG: hypothetical protein WBA23_01185 [Tunicatimonas sp.]|uniref:hypothetical protein n=1 Tax=Tunicatimonas sp. TaxID=1940096 RepID=UPI003C77E0A5
MGIDAVLLIGSFFIHTAVIPNYLLVIIILGWWILLLLTNQYQPSSIKFPKIISSTGLAGIGHLTFTIVICTIGQKLGYVSPLVRLILLFYISRIAVFALLHKLYYYALNVTDNMLRFVIIGDKEAAISKLLLNYLLQSEAKFVGYVNTNSVDHLQSDSLLELYQKLLSKGVSHIYCTLPLPEWTAHVNKLQQMADDHFIYFHWLSDFGLEDSPKQHLDFRMKNIMVYTSHK